MAVTLPLDPDCTYIQPSQTWTVCLPWPSLGWPVSTSGPVPPESIVFDHAQRRTPVLVPE